jgi:hypothetical protein
VNHLALSTGAKAGIGAGIALVFLVLLALFLFLIFGRKKRREREREREQEGTGVGSGDGLGGIGRLGGMVEKTEGRQSFPPPYPGSPTFRREPPPRRPLPVRNPTMELESKTIGPGFAREEGREIVEADGVGRVNSWGSDGRNAVEADGVGRMNSWGSAGREADSGMGRLNSWGEGEREYGEVQGDQFRYELSGNARYSEMPGVGVFRGHEMGDGRRRE